MSEINEQLVQAGEHLMDSVYIPSFIKQCQARGITFDTAEDLQAAIQNVAQIKQAKEQQKSATPSIHKIANQALGTTDNSQSEATQDFGRFLNDVQVDENAVKAAALLSQAEQNSE